MNDLLNTLLEEKEKLDELYRIEEQHRKRIHENFFMIKFGMILVGIVKCLIAVKIYNIQISWMRSIFTESFFKKIKKNEVCL